MKDVQFVDTTLRDGQLSLWALGMKTGAMLAIAEQVDRCGFQSLEFFGFASFIKYVREHKEILSTGSGSAPKNFTARGCGIMAAWPQGSKKCRARYAS